MYRRVRLRIFGVAAARMAAFAWVVGVMVQRGMVQHGIVKLGVARHGAAWRGGVEQYGDLQQGGGWHVASKYTIDKYIYMWVDTSMDVCMAVWTCVQTGFSACV